MYLGEKYVWDIIRCSKFCVIRQTIQITERKLENMNNRDVLFIAFEAALNWMIRDAIIDSDHIEVFRNLIDELRETDNGLERYLNNKYDDTFCTISVRLNTESDQISIMSLERYLCKYILSKHGYKLKPYAIKRFCKNVAIYFASINCNRGI